MGLDKNKLSLIIFIIRHSRVSKSLYLGDKHGVKSRLYLLLAIKQFTCILFGSQFPHLYNRVNKVSILPKVVWILIFIKYEYA